MTIQPKPELGELIRQDVRRPLRVAGFTKISGHYFISLFALRDWEI